MALNWRRGLLRLWLVGSLAWIATCGFIAKPYETFFQWNEARLTMERVKQDAGNYNTDLCRRWVNMLQNQGVRPEKQDASVVVACYGKAKKDGQDDSIIVTLISNMGWSHDEFIEYLRDNVDRRDKSLERLKQFLIVSLAPPFLVLILGYGLLWAGSGFHSK